ncbi:DNA repair protein RecO [Aerococcaceae bacterium WGS1372]
MNERFDGIVLFKRKHRENDALVKIFTDNYGTKMFFVKGLQKPNHRLNTQLIPLTFNNYLGNINQDGLSFLKEATTQNFNWNIQSDYKKQAYASYVAQLVDAAIEDNTENKQLFLMFSKSLELIENNDFYEIITIAMEIKLLKYFGTDVNFTECIVCQTQKQPFDFSIRLNGVLCEHHFHEDEFRLQINPRAMYIASQLDKVSFNQIQSINVSSDTKQELRRLMDEIYKEYVGINLKSKSYLNNLDTLGQSIEKVIQKRKKSN